MSRSSRHPLDLALGLATTVAASGYAWVTTGFRPFTAPALIATLAGGLVAIVLGQRLLPWPARAGPAPASGAWVWTLLAAAVGVWQLQSFLQHPRAEHPTISSLSNDLLQGHASRAAAMVAWLAAGVWLARR